MIVIEFTSTHSRQDRTTLVREHIGQIVTAYTIKGAMFSGPLNAATSAAVTVGGQAIPLMNLKRLHVSVGGDWGTLSGHSETAMVERLHVRCTTQEKLDAERASSLAGYANLGPWIRSLINREAARLLKRKP